MYDDIDSYKPEVDRMAWAAGKVEEIVSGRPLGCRTWSEPRTHVRASTYRNEVCETCGYRSTNLEQTHRSDDYQHWARTVRQSFVGCGVYLFKHCGPGATMNCSFLLNHWATLKPHRKTGHANTWKGSVGSPRTQI